MMKSPEIAKSVERTQNRTLKMFDRFSVNVLGFFF